MNTRSIVSDIHGRIAGGITALRHWLAHAAAVAMRFKSLAPYALIELVLPGGSVMALLLWLYRRQKSAAASGVPAQRTTGTWWWLGCRRNRRRSLAVNSTIIPLQGVKA